MGGVEKEPVDRTGAALGSPPAGEGSVRGGTHSSPGTCLALRAQRQPPSLIRFFTLTTKPPLDSAWFFHHPFD